jgi:hypothetical protein
MGKDKKVKEKKVKEKRIYFKANIYSDKFSSLFNNTKYSDITVKVGDETYKLHKNVLHSSSDFFSSNLDGNELTVDESDKTNFKRYLEFLYTGALEVSNEDYLFDFFLLALKYKTKNLDGIQVYSKKLLTKLIEFAEKDKNNVSDFEKLLGSVNFKKFDEDYLAKLSKKVIFI